MFNSVSKCRIHRISDIVVASAQYLASVEERPTIDCFLVLYNIGVAPRKMQKSVVNLRSFLSLAQSKTKKVNKNSKP